MLVLVMLFIRLEKTKQQMSPKIMNQLLKIIYRPCCEQFHVGGLFSFKWIAVQTEVRGEMQVANVLLS